MIGETPVLAVIVGAAVALLVIGAYVVIWKLWQNKKVP